MTVSDRTTGRLLVGVPLLALGLVAAFGAYLVLTRSAVPRALFGCWRTDSTLLAIEPPTSITIYRHLVSSSDHVGGWIHQVDSSEIKARIIVFPMDFAVQAWPVSDTLGERAIIDSVTYHRAPFDARDSTCSPQ